MLGYTSDAKRIKKN